MNILTEEQIRRQDIVDNTIYQLICDINPTDKNIEWDIELIGEVRDVIRTWLVEKIRITDEQKFYPYIKD